ncbi:hypothetical protein C8Q77DRAFT_160626 [Trametes polyzona]|nr:hypothetical protein C8Q77DRAFT_160626 [Trametes polyzona]
MGASFNPPSDTTMSIPPQPPKLDLTFGAFLIGTFISVVLYGGVLQQSHRYIRFYAPEDTAFVKAIVALILVTETTGVATCIHACYHYLVTNYANPAALQFTCWSLNLQSALVGLVIFLAQTFYARRVYLCQFCTYSAISSILTTPYLVRPGYAALVAIAVSLSILSLVFGTAASVLGFSSGTFPTFRQYTWLDSVGLSTAVMSDLLTTSVLVVFLARSRTGFQKTDHILDRLIQYLLNTGMILCTSLCHELSDL